MASYKGQTRTAYTEKLRAETANHAKEVEKMTVPAIETESKQEPKKRGRKPKEV